MTTTTAKYGYVITSTPGLLEEGSFALSAEALKKGEIKRSIPGESDAAVFATVAEADAAMLALVPEGSTPGSYAGLGVEPTWEACPQALVYGWVEGQNGFEIREATL